MRRSPFLGRETEMEQARSAMARPVRLLSLWGPPGIGKTRLARELTRDLDATFVALPRTSARGGLGAAIEPALRGRTGGWVVLDAVESLDDAQGDEGLAYWLDRAPKGVSFLVTSRRRLHHPDVYSVLVPPLDETSSLALFSWLVRNQRAGLEPDAPSQVLRGVVGRLEGVPLALELAAARWELLGPEGLLRRLEQPLDVLGSSRAPEPRHASLRRAIQGSWELLDPDEKRVLEGVARFEGQFTAEDAESLLGTPALGQLDALRDAALIQGPTAGRFQLLSSIHAFAREQTSSERAEILVLAHARWLIARYPDLDLESPPARVRDDLVVAAQVLVERDDPRAGHLLELLSFVAPGHHLGLLDAAVERLGTAMTRLVRSRALLYRRHFDAAAEDVAAALAMDAGPRTRSLLWIMQGVIAQRTGDFDAARAGHTRALELAREIGNRRVEAVATGNLGALESDLGHLESAQRRFAAAREAFRDVGDVKLEATVLSNEGLLYQSQGLNDRAERTYRRALELLVGAADLRLRGVIGTNLGILLHELHRVGEARACLETTLEDFAQSPDLFARANALVHLATVEATDGDHGAARRYLDQARRLGPPTRDGDLWLFELQAAFVRSRASGDDAELVALLDAVPRDAPPARRGARSILRLLDRDPPALRVDAGGFTVAGDERVDLVRFGSLLRMFQALVEAREQGAGSRDTEALFEAGWPGERASWSSIRNRVHVNLAKLRRLGLRDLLLRDEHGYLLDPAVPLVRASHGSSTKS